jgi:Tfp pilus assembly protein FimT
MLEIVVVLAILLILGAIILPTLKGFFRDTRVQAAVDQCRSRATLARALAVEQGRIYVFEVSQDGRQIRIQPDPNDLAGVSSEEDGNTPRIRIETLPDEVTLVPRTADPAQGSPDGWIRLATFLADGTCREQTVQFELSEPGVLAMTIEIRGLTGTSTIVSPAALQEQP